MGPTKWTAGSLLAAGAVMTIISGASAQQSLPVADRVEAKLADAMAPLESDQVQLTGFLGDRVARNATNRLLQVNEDALLAGFRKRPGEQAWIGEHVGKWLHAATLAWVNTRNPELRAKLDRVVVELLKTQEPDGYLGTYTPETRFGKFRNADWDVWVHKYNLIGLLTYHRYTGNEEALRAAVRIGDLLVKTFGPGKKSILSAGTHVGMASTSVLEPMVYLYRRTGDRRYLEFAEYIVRSWDEPGGPRVLTTILKEKSVAKTANGKAYEMLSNLVGLCELARVTGNRRYLTAAELAWRDVTATQLYITGSASHHELFHEGHDLPNIQSANVGETCVTVTWIQLNAQLLRLTGEAKYGTELERSYYNHLAGAQRPDGAEWCYYTALEGRKPYGPGINCCVSSGPRGMALAPSLAYLKVQSDGKEAVAVNLFDSSTATIPVGGGELKLDQSSNIPRGSREGNGFTARATFTIRSAPAKAVSFWVRIPEWAGPLQAHLNDRSITAERRDGWAILPERQWKAGDALRLTFPIRVRLLAGEHGNAGRAALLYGPLVLAYDQSLNPMLSPPRGMGYATETIRTLELAPPDRGAIALTATLQDAKGADRDTVLVPFALAGSTGGRYGVWLRAPGAPLPAADSPFAFGEESRSRQGNVLGEIADGDTGTFVVTFDGRPGDEDWFAVRRSEPVQIRRLVYAHGKTFHDGGWFDASAGKPRFQVQATEDGPWITVGELQEYPETTATDSRGIKDGQAFTLRLKEPVKAVAIRIIGKPSSGDNPRQAFASCAELQAFAD